MPTRTAPAAAPGTVALALGLLIAATPAAGGDLEERYHAGLLERGLFGVAEGANLRTLRDPAATPTQRQTAAVRLAAALAEHARFTDGPERDALRARAAETLADLAAAHPALPAVRTDLAAALVDATHARRLGRDALPELRPTPVQVQEANAALRAADRRLAALSDALHERRKNLTRGRTRDAEPLTAAELVDLTEAAALALAELRIVRAILTPDVRVRKSLAESVESLALPIRGQTLQKRRSLLLSDSRRLSGDSRGAVEALAAMPGARGDAAVAATLRIRLETAGPGDAAARVATLRGDASASADAGPTVLGAETEFVSALVLSRLATEARTAGRADLADRLLGRLRRDADRAVAAHGGPWAARADRLADLANRSAGLPADLAAAIEAAEALDAAGDPGAPAALLAAARSALNRSALTNDVAPAVRLSLARRAADRLRDAGDRDAAVDLLEAALAGAPATAEAASAHFLYGTLLADRFAANPSPETHRALAGTWNEHRTRFAAFPTAAAATWRLARHEETRDQRSAALPLYRALLDDPTRRIAAAAGLARCHEGILAYLADRQRRATAAGEPTLALARRLQSQTQRAAAIAELTPLAEAFDLPEEPSAIAPALRAARAELQLRTARLLLTGGGNESAKNDSENRALAARLLAAVRVAAAGEPGDASTNAGFWRAAGREATGRAAVLFASLGRYEEAARSAAALPDEAAALLPVSAGWAAAGRNRDPAFAAARTTLADRLLALPLAEEDRRTVRVRRAAALLDRGEPTAAATELLNVLDDAHDPQTAALAAEAVAASRSPQLAAAALTAWRRAEAARPEGSADWLAARARRIAGLHAAGRRAEAAKLLTVTRLLHPELKSASPETRRRFAALTRTLGDAAHVATDDARAALAPRR